MTKKLTAMLGLALPLMVLGNVATYILLLLAMIGAFVTPFGSLPERANWRHVLGNSYLRGAVVLLVWLGGCSVAGISPDYSLRHWVVVLLMFAIGIVLFGVFSQMNDTQRSSFLKWMADGVLAMFVVAGLIMILEPWLIQHGFYQQGDAWTQTRLRFYSSVLAVILPLCWLNWLMDANGRLRLDWKAMGFIGLSLFMVFMCAGRAGWLGLAFSGSFMAFALIRRQGFRPDIRILLGGLIVTLIACIGAYVWIFGASSLSERIGVTVPDRGLGGGRLEIWNLAWQNIWENPVFGIGVNAFRYLPHADAHPHNFLLQLALEGGIPALVMALLLLGGTMIKWWKFMGESSVKGRMLTATGAALIGFAVCALTNKSIFNPEWLVYLVVIIAFGTSLLVGNRVEAASINARPAKNLSVKANKGAKVR